MIQNDHITQQYRGSGSILGYDHKLGMQSDLNAFCQVIYFIHGYKIVDPLVHIWDNFAFGLSIVIFVKSSRVHIMQEYIDR